MSSSNEASLPISTQETPLLLHHDQQHYSSPPKQPRIKNLKAKISFTLRILIVLIVGFIIIYSIYTKNQNPKPPHNSYLSGLSKYYCHLTRHHKLCHQSMPSIITNLTALRPNPAHIFTASLQLVVNQLNHTTTAISKALSSPSSNNTTTYLSTCQVNVNDSLSRLNRSLGFLGVDLFFGSFIRYISRDFRNSNSISTTHHNRWSTFSLMEPSNGSSSKRRSLVDEQDVNISTFRRGNKIIAVVFTLLIISLTLLITTLVIQLRRRIPHKPAGIPPLLQFCYVTNTPACLATFRPLITGKSITDPNQIFALSLQTAAADLQHIINTSLTDTQNPAFNSCSNSLSDGLGRVSESLATMRVNPFVGSLSEEQRDEMMKRIVAAGEDVESCLDDLAKEMTAKLVNVQVYLGSAVDFIAGHEKNGRLLNYYVVEDNDFYRSVISGNLIICGLQLLFVFGLFCSLFRTR